MSIFTVIKIFIFRSIRVPTIPYDPLVCSTLDCLASVCFGPRENWDPFLSCKYFYLQGIVQFRECTLALSLQNRDYFVMLGFVVKKSDVVKCFKYWKLKLLYFLYTLHYRILRHVKKLKLKIKIFIFPMCW